jgi:glycosyltransferase involved in cell wall biosynthesis
MSDAYPGENLLPKEKPRLLMVAPKLAVGGVEKFNLDLLQQLNRLGWEVTVATTEREAHSWLPLFARFTPDVFVLCHFLQLADYPRFLSYLVRSRDVDAVLVSNSQLGYQLLPYLRSRHPHVSFVDVSHVEDERWRNGGTPRMAVTYQELLDLNLVVSSHLKRWMVDQGADGDRVRVSYCNVDVEKWQPHPDDRAAVRRELGVDVATPLVLFAGRLCAQKQPSVLAQTLLLLARKNCRFVAVVAGDGPDLAWLRNFVGRHRLADRVRVLGGVASDRVRRLMCAADVLFLPSKYEGIALVLYEAMACGLCVVTADVGGQGELVTPECGVLVTPRGGAADVQGYAAVLEELLGDPERCRGMGRAGRERVAQNFRVDRMGERVVSLLREAIRLHDERPRPIPSTGLGRACAVEAIELTRLGDVAGRLLKERTPGASSAPLAGVNVNSHLLDPYHAGPRALVYFTMQALLASYYRKALSWKAMGWLVPLKDRLKRAFVGEAGA